MSFHQLRNVIVWKPISLSTPNSVFLFVFPYKRSIPLLVEKWSNAKSTPFTYPCPSDFLFPLPAYTARTGRPNDADWLCLCGEVDDILCNHLLQNDNNTKITAKIKRGREHVMESNGCYGWKYFLHSPPIKILCHSYADLLTERIEMLRRPHFIFRFGNIN